MKRCLAAILLVFCLCGIARAAEAPGAGVMLLLGEIGQHKGKVVVLNFFATWCAPCREEIPGLVRLRKEFKPTELVILGISLDETQEPIQEFIREYGINYPVKAASEDVVHMFGVRSVPHNTVYDTNGRLVANQPGLVDADVFKEVVYTLLEQKK